MASIQQDQQDITDAESALQALGLTSDKFDQALQQLIKRRNAQQEIDKVKQSQFSSDAINLINQVQAFSSSSDKVVAISQFMRQFAEYVATQTQTLQGKYATISDIVDHIMPMG